MCIILLYKKYKKDFKECIKMKIEFNLKNDIITEVAVSFGRHLYGLLSLENPVPDVKCSCTGNTQETATVTHYEDGCIVCPKCGAIKGTLTKKGVQQIKKHEREESEKPLKLVPAFNDWEALGQLYKLNKKISQKDWEKIKSYMRYVSPSEFEDISVRGTSQKGWVCREENVPKVKELLGIEE